MAGKYTPLSSISSHQYPIDMHLKEFDSLVDASALISTDRLGNFVEAKTGRRLHLKGINLDASAKLPTSPENMTSHRSTKDGLFWDGDHVSFVGRPFPLDEAETHFNRIKSWGYNTIRYIITWEAIEHLGPGKYDDDYIDYTFQIFKSIEKIGGLFVFIDPHQDVWSRFTGGSGAPLWTLYAAGLNPHRFATTEAAFIHNNYPDPASFPKMVWPTNYTRLATFTMFTMFFSGRKFFPKCIIDGVNIQDYLQSHFLNSLSHFMRRLKTEHPHLINTVIIGLETVNEPSLGLYGREDLSRLPKEQQLRVYTSPTPFEAMKLGMGIPCEIDTYEIRITGPTKTGSKLVNEQRDCCWVQDSKWDRHYGFHRDEDWEIGTCVYALHGIWDIDSQTLLIPDYFGKDPVTGENLNIDTFVNENFLDHYISFKTMLRLVDSELFLFMQVPVFELPPDLISDDTGILDDRTVLCQHYYDGMSLMFKTWNTRYNVDTLGILRGRYLNPVFAIVFGERNIRKCIRNQFYELKQEKIEYLGKRVPIMVSETGMPFDMDGKLAFEDGDYSSQIAALDCISYALESNNLSHTYWTYSSVNNHKWGDQWNNEDFAFWSKDDSTKSLRNERSFNIAADTLVTTVVSDFNSKYVSNHASDSEVTINNGGSDQGDYQKNTRKLYGDGVRALDSTLRPYPVLVNGIVKECIFDLKNLTFQLIISTKSSIPNGSPTVIFLPLYHFPPDSISVEVSSGKTSYYYNSFLQVLEWDHDVNIGQIELNISVTDQDQDSNYQFGSFNGNRKKGYLKDYACGAGCSCIMQ